MSNVNSRPGRALAVEPIGHIETPHRDKASAPRQPRAAEGTPGTIRLLPGRGFEDALADLEGFSHVWVLFWFDQAEGWHPKVLPPRSTKKRGLFATRSPHRPNPIGMSVVRLEKIEGLTLHVRDVDLLDGTPILDLKPYVRWADSVPDATDGWLEPLAEATGAGRPSDPGPRYQVKATAEAEAALGFLRAHGVDLWPRIEASLSIGPQPHAYRRIKPDRGAFRLAVKEFRAWFTVEGDVVEVFRIGTGFRPKELEVREDLALHRDLEARFPSAVP